jgi:hypothetical protein
MVLTFSCQNVESSFCCVEIGKIFNHQSNCVKKIEEGKIYLNESQILPTSEGLFLVLSEEVECVHLPQLFSDSSGCFIPSPEMGYSDIARSKMICPRCGWSGYFMGHCKNEDCELNR